MVCWNTEVALGESDWDKEGESETSDSEFEEWHRLEPMAKQLRIGVWRSKKVWQFFGNFLAIIAKNCQIFGNFWQFLAIIAKILPKDCHTFLDLLGVSSWSRRRIAKNWYFGAKKWIFDAKNWYFVSVQKIEFSYRCKKIDMIEFRIIEICKRLNFVFKRLKVNWIHYETQETLIYFNLC